MGYKKSTSINVIMAEAYESLFADRMEFLGMNYIGKVISQSNHPLNNIFYKL